MGSHAPLRVALPLPPLFGEALCREGWDPALWDLSVAGETGVERRDRLAAAAAVCSQCPCQQACARVAEADSLATGVWGGRIFHASGTSFSEICGGVEAEQCVAR